MDWRERIRNLWVDRMIWIRNYIVSMIFGLRISSHVVMRTLRNGSDIARLFSHFYGLESANKVEELLTQYILILSEMATTLLTGGDIEPLKTRWSDNSNGLIEVLVSVNPYVNEAALREAVELQFQLELDLVQHFVQGKYAEGVSSFDASHDNATRIANILIDAIAAQFQI